MLAWTNNRAASARLYACAAFAAAAVAVSAGSAAAQTSKFMPEGEPSPAPLAFLNFCARLPSECAPAARTGSDAVAAGDMAVDAAAQAAATPQLATAALSADASTPAAPDTPPPSESAAPAPPQPAGAVMAAPAAPAATPLPYTPGLMRELAAVNRRVNRAIKPQTDLQTVGVAERWDLPLEEGLKGGDCEDYVLEKRRALVADGVPLQDLSIAIAITRWGVPHAVLLVTTDRGELVMDNLTDWIVPWQEENFHWIARQAPGRTFEWITIGPTSA